MNHLTLEKNGRIAVLTLNRPDAMNALNNEVLDELYEAFGLLEADKDVGIIVLTGAGKAFVAGADIAAMRDMDAREGRALMANGHRVMNRIENLQKPVIAAVNGFALGGGCELAMACDIRIASTRAKFGQPEVNLGIIPGFGGTQRLPRLVGAGMAKYMIMTGEIIGAEEAARIGLVEKVVPAEELMDTAMKVAETILSKAPIAIAAAKAVINAGAGLGMAAASLLEVEATTGPLASRDKNEGMGAFLEKRAPEFKNE
jgi:enoyl-CoA hydratase